MQKAQVISNLQQQILLMQGFKPRSANESFVPKLDQIDHAFPNKTFPVAAIHEFIQPTNDPSPTFGFVSCLLSSLMQKKRVSVWISSRQTIFPPALKYYSIEPSHFIFIHLRKHRELFWVTEEAMKCNGIAAVVSELPHLDFITSRRLQLAAEQSKATCFIIRKQTKTLPPNVSTARWCITSMSSINEEGMPGVGTPVWNVELLKIRSGKPGSWMVQFKNGSLEILNNNKLFDAEIRKAV